MRILDKKRLKLNNGSEDLDIIVYLKEINVRNNHTGIKAFCKIIKD